MQGASNGPVEACLACAASPVSNPVERQANPRAIRQVHGRSGTRKACLYGSTCATFQSPWELFIVLQGPHEGGSEGQEVSPSNRTVGEDMGK